MAIAETAPQQVHRARHPATTLQNGVLDRGHGSLPNSRTQPKPSAGRARRRGVEPSPQRQATTRWGGGPGSPAVMAGTPGPWRPGDSGLAGIPARWSSTPADRRCEMVRFDFCKSEGAGRQAGAGPGGGGPRRGRAPLALRGGGGPCPSKYTRPRKVFSRGPLGPGHAVSAACCLLIDALLVTPRPAENTPAADHDRGPARPGEHPDPRPEDRVAGRLAGLVRAWAVCVRHRRALSDIRPPVPVSSALCCSRPAAPGAPVRARLGRRGGATGPGRRLPALRPY